MSDDIAKLQIRIETLEAQAATKRLKGLEQQSGRTERATDGLTGSFARLMGPIAGVVSVSAGLTKLVNTAREFDVLNAKLTTATGSAEGAAEAFTHLQDFAANTPYDLQQTVAAFTQLVNYGLTPSEEAMMSYGDTASALGADLSQMVEAVADATTGEFERLKAFGIKSSKEGEQIAFTFRGVTTKVKNSADEIEQYLIKLGQNSFGGSMAERMASLDGAVSNLGDEWDKLFLNLSNQGPGELIEDSVRLGISALEELNGLLASGQLSAYLDAMSGKFEGFGDDVALTLDILTGLWADFLGSETGGGITNATGDAVAFMTDSFSNMPENIRAFIQVMTVELLAFVDKTGAYGQEMLDNLQFWQDETFDLDAELARLNGVRADSVQAIMDERNAAISSFDAQIQGASNLRSEYEFLSNSRKAFAALEEVGFSFEDQGRGKDLLVTYQGVTREVGKSAEAFDDFLQSMDIADQKALDLIERLRSASSFDEVEVLGKFKIAAPERSTATEEIDKAAVRAAERLQKQRERDFNNLVASLRTEEEAVIDSYERRQRIILENTQESSALQQDLLARSEQQYLEQLEAIRSAEDEKAGLMEGTAQTMENAFTNAFMNIDQGLDNLVTSFARAMAQMVAQQSASQIAGGITGWLGMGTAAAGGGGGAAAGASMGSMFAGLFDSGGHIPAGKFGVVGEIGPELIQGPAQVTGRKQTQQLIEQAASQQGGGNQQPAPAPANVQVVNQLDPTVFNQWAATPDFERTVINCLRNNSSELRGYITG